MIPNSQGNNFKEENTFGGKDHDMTGPSLNNGLFSSNPFMMRGGFMDPSFPMNHPGMIPS